MILWATTKVRFHGKIKIKKIEFHGPTENPPTNSATNSINTFYEESMNIFRTPVPTRRESGVQNKVETELKGSPKHNELTNFFLNYCSTMFVKGQKESNDILETMQSCSIDFREK